MLKLTIPSVDDFYADLVKHPKVLRVVALSGGYSRDEANALLARNHGVIASFSRALTEGLTAQQSDEAVQPGAGRGDRQHLPGVLHVVDGAARRTDVSASRDRRRHGRASLLRRRTAFTSDRRQRDRASRRRRASCNCACCASHPETRSRSSTERAASITGRSSVRASETRGRGSAGSMPCERESALTTTLAQAIVAADTMDTIVRHAVELGVAAIQPVVTERSARFPSGAHGDKRLAHWRHVARSGCEQCGRNRVPAVRDPVPLAEWLSHPRAGVVFDAGAQASLASLPTASAARRSRRARRRAHRARESRTRCARACALRASARVSFARILPRCRRSQPSICCGATSDEARRCRSRPRSRWQDA